MMQMRAKELSLARKFDGQLVVVIRGFLSTEPDQLRARNLFMYDCKGGPASLEVARLSRKWPRQHPRADQ